MLPQCIFALLLAGPKLVTAAAKTSIYLDQIPLYSQLPQCAMDRMSAIIRAQSSGCGDGGQLTSFTCFCMDQPSHMSGIISTAVDQSCRAKATASITSSGPLPEVTSALELFQSYCARSTELSLYQEGSGVITITKAPTPTPSPTQTSPPKSSGRSVPVAAIVAPVVVGVFVIAGIVGLLLVLRRRRAASENANAQEMPAGSAPPTYHGGEMADNTPAAGELKGSTTRYAHELESRPYAEPAELDGNGNEDEKARSSQEKP